LGGLVAVSGRNCRRGYQQKSGAIGNEGAGSAAIVTGLNAAGIRVRSQSCWRHRNNWLVWIPAARATSEAIAPGTSAAATIVTCACCETLSMIRPTVAFDADQLDDGRDQILKRTRGGRRAGSHYGCDKSPRGIKAPRGSPLCCKPADECGHCALYDHQGRWRGAEEH
jgi:hypothetical protein